MGKRSTFERRERDAYDTPASAVDPLLPHIPTHQMPRHRKTFAEPCAGKGDLVAALRYWARCVYAGDVAPRAEWITRQNADQWRAAPDVDYIITNPPWSRPILHRMIEHFSDMRPTWLLFDADWMHTRQSAPYMWRCRKIVSVGRVKWIEDSPHTGKDDVAWYLFDAHQAGPTEFVGRG